MAAATSESGPADRLIHPTANLPEETGAPVSVGSADRSNLREGLLHRTLDGDFATVGQRRSPGPVWIARDFARGGPACFDIALLRFTQRRFDRGFDAQAITRHQSHRIVVPANGAVLQSFGQWSGDAAADRRHQTDPEAAEVRSQNGNRQDDSATQFQFLRHHLHDIAIRHDVGAADVQGLAGRFFHIQTSDEVAKDIANRDGLGFGFDPLGSDHDRQTLHQVTQRFKGCGPGADDHRGAEHGGGDAAGLQDFTDFVSAVEVFGKIGTQLAQPTEVDDSSTRRFLGGVSEPGRKLTVSLSVFTLGRLHGMNEVIRHIDLLESTSGGLGVFQFALDDGETLVLPPRKLGQLFGTSDQTSHLVALFQQPSGQASSDIAGGTANQDAFVARSRFRHEVNRVEETGVCAF